MTTGARRMPVLAVAALGSLLLSFDLSGLPVALPSAQADLGASAAGLAWCQNAYALALTMTLPVLGALGDRLGRAQAFRMGAVLFALASVLVALAPSTPVLVAARALEGVGGAALLVLGLALVADVWGADLPRAIGVTTAASVGGLAAGPVVTGLLVELAGWRGALLVEAALAAVLALGALVALRRWPSTPARRADVGSAVLASLALGLLVVALHALHPGAPTAAAALGVIGAVVLGAVLVRRERRAADPLLPRVLRDSSAYRVAALLGALTYAAVSASQYYLSLYVQQSEGWSAASAGLLLLPVAVGIVLGVSIAPAALRARGARALLAWSLALAAVGVLAMSAVALGAWVAVIAGAAVSGIGVGLASPQALAYGMAGARDADSGTASAGLWTARMAGTSVGFALLSVLALAQATLLAGVCAVLLASAVLFVVAALVAVRGVPGALSLRAPRP